MPEIQKSYYAIIPANVRYDRELTPNAKLLYGEITALCNEKGYCWAYNQYFADLYEVSKVSISKWISQLFKKGYIDIEIIYKEGTKEILHRYITIVNGGIKEKLNRGIKEKFKDNSTSINNTNNITYNKKEASTPSKQKEKELTAKEEISNFVQSYNQQEIIVDGEKQYCPDFSEEETELITQYILDRKESYKSKVKNTRKALRGLLSNIKTVSKEIPLEIIFKQNKDGYVHSGTSGDATKPYQSIKLEYYKDLLLTFKKHNANANTLRGQLTQHTKEIRQFNPEQCF
jgi:hypothetical protein